MRFRILANSPSDGRAYRAITLTRWRSNAHITPQVEASHITPPIFQVALLASARDVTLTVQDGRRTLRTHTRFQVDIAITLEVRAREVTVTGHLVDLGEGGAACRLDGPLRVGDRVTLRVLTEVPQVLAAEVAWVAWGESTSVRLGLRFDAEQEQIVNALINFSAASAVGA